MKVKINHKKDTLHELINACLIAKKEGLNSFKIEFQTSNYVEISFKRVSTEKERLIQEVTKAREEYEELKRELKELG
tara:strand:- start:7399 stop:7629 length:231 start_codon:yes stop_codon:yes gene_type:complete